MGGFVAVVEAGDDERVAGVGVLQNDGDFLGLIMEHGRLITWVMDYLRG